VLKSLAKSLLRHRGYELKPIGAPIRGAENFIQHLRNKGFEPGTVVDVGVAKGTPWLYEFPEAKLVLIEPNDQFDTELAAIKRRHDADVFVCAAGAEVGQLSLHVDQFAPSSSSLYAAADDLKRYWQKRGQQRRLQSKMVDVRPLDAILEGRYRPPYLIKLDTEGFELEALRGAIDTLEETAVLIVEASVAKRHEGSYEFADLVQFLSAKDFRLADIIDIAVFDGDGDIAYMDVVFTRADGTMNHKGSGPL
jgi:FkbM family methyltransferase